MALIQMTPNAPTGLCLKVEERAIREDFHPPPKLTALDEGLTPRPGSGPRTRISLQDIENSDHGAAAIISDTRRAQYHCMRGK